MPDLFTELVPVSPPPEADSVPSTDTPPAVDENPFASVDVPQADDLDRILRLVSLLARDAPVDAHSLGVGRRNVDYYFSASRLLGFTDLARCLLPAGRALASLTEELKRARLALAFEYSEFCQAWLRHARADSIQSLNAESAEPFIRSRTRLGGDTVGRRAATLGHWLSLFWNHHPFRPQQQLPFASPGDTVDRGPDRPHFDRGGALAAINLFAPGTRLLRVASAYFTVPGYERVAHHLTGAKIQLLLGSSDAEGEIHAVIEAFRRSIEQGLPTYEKREATRRLYTELVSGSLRVRHMEVKQFQLHAKVFIFDDRATLVGSANLTGSGLKTNVEAGYLSCDPTHVRYFQERFDVYFAKGRELIDKLLPPLEQSWLFATAPSPWHVYLRTLLEIYHEPSQAPPSPYALATFQEMIVGSTLRALLQHRRVMLISPTGTGKTVMAAYLAAILCRDTITRVILVPPNDTLAKKWTRHFREFGLPLDVIKHGRLQGKGRAASEVDPELALIAKSLRSTDLLVVDESHAFRNDESQGFSALEALLKQSGEAIPWCLLLTATPISTGVMDLNHQLDLLGAQRLHTIEDIASAEQVINVTLPLIVRGFGSAPSAGRARSLTFGQERRYFPNIRFRTRYYTSALSSLIPLIRSMDLRFERASTTALREIGASVDESATTSSASTLLRVVLARLAESSLHALRAGVDRLTERLQTGEIVAAAPEAFAEGLRALAEASRAIEGDAKLETLVAELESGNARTLVFTSFTDTAEYLHRRLTERFPKRRVGLVTGAVPPSERARILERFAPVAHGGNRRRRKFNLDILICTDAISEGEDLQDATTLVNYDLHWTPLRLIQRVGRVDRATTHQREVSVANFYPGESEFEEFLNLWGRLESRAGTYEVFAETTILRDFDRDLSREIGGRADVRSLYEATDYLELLAKFLPATNHLAQLFEAQEEDLSAAKALPVGSRTARYSDSAGTFALLRAGGTRGGAWHDEVNGTCTFAPTRLGSADAVPYEVFLHRIRSGRDEAPAPLPVEFDARLGQLVTAWARHVGEHEGDVTIVCAVALVAPPPNVSG